MNADISVQIDFLKASLDKPVVLIGLMGAGKSKIGEALAKALDIKILDSDEEIVKVHGPISGIFENKGEPAFREIEKDVISSLLAEGVSVLSTGGGAFVQEATRQVIKEQALSVWLHAELDTLYERVKHSKHRPLLETGEPKEVILQRFIDERYPVYAQADIHVTVSDDGLGKEDSIAKNCDRVINALYSRLQP